MKTKSTYWFSGMFRALVLGAGLVTSTLSSVAQDARFFRIAGPVATGITELRSDGTLVWTNTPTNATFIVQTATSLAGASNWVDYIQTPVTNGITTNRVIDFNPPSGMALIPAGNFTWGNALSDDAYPGAISEELVYVSAFYMDRDEVTKALWDEVYNWAITHGYSFDNAGMGNAANHPVQTVNWYDCVKWCNARSEKEGQAPAYYIGAAQTVVYRSGRFTMDNSWVKWNTGYRLPKEVEWEKAARGGRSGQRFPWGNTITHSLANYNSSGSYAYDISPTRGYHPSFNGTSPVRYFAPNGYGLYDMAGNVWEWCWDWSQGSYGGYGAGRVMRGGSWYTDALYCRVVFRIGLDPDIQASNIGFRCVLPTGQP